MRRRTFILALAAVLCLLALPVGARQVREKEPVLSKNIYAYDGTAVPNSYLCPNDVGGLTRVEFDGDDGMVYVEDYDAEFRFRSRQGIEPELPLWGGFYRGQKHYFLVFGQENPDRDDLTEVVRVVEYDRSWKRLGAASLYGGSTMMPFEGGTTSFDEFNDMLYVRLGRRSYAGRQAGMTLVINTKNAQLLEGHFGADDDSFNYAGFSASQSILVDRKQRVVMMDAAEDSLLVNRSRIPAGITEQAYAILVHGSTVDDISTLTGRALETSVLAKTGGCAVGGFAEIGSGYISVWSGPEEADGQRKVYLGFTEPEYLSTSKRVIGTTAGTPWLVSKGISGGWILWNGCDKDGKPTNELFYAKYNERGDMGQTRSATVPLSDCRPIVRQGKVIWYVTNDSAPTFYVMDDTGIKALETGVIGGACGKSTTWELDPATRTLTISGTGAIDSYSIDHGESAPWSGHLDLIEKIVVSEGVTRVGSRAFHSCRYATDVYLADGVETIGMWAFTQCASLKHIAIPASVVSVERYAFQGCDSLSDVFYGGDEDLWQKVFRGGENDALTSASIHCGTTTDPSMTPPTVDEGMAYASNQKVKIGTRAVEFQMYALLDEKGNPTNYVKVRDLAYVLRETNARFAVEFDQTTKEINLVPDGKYETNGSEMKTPFTGNRAYKVVRGTTLVNGKTVEVDAIRLESDAGGGFTYYKLRDLGEVLGFEVGWTQSKGVYIETNLGGDTSRDKDLKKK